MKIIKHKIFALILGSSVLSAHKGVRAEIANEPILPLPQTLDLNSTLVELGKKLFRDPRLSNDQTQSCAGCHDLAGGGINPADVMRRGINEFNTPTIFNVGFHFKFLWTGRAESLEEQVEIAVKSPTVLNNTWSKILERLKDDEHYQSLASRIDPNKPLSEELIKRAIAEYERSLWTPNAPFDKYLRGDPTAINEEEKRGYQIFKDLGCSSCHQGMLLGGNMFQKFGIFQTPGSIQEKTFSARDLGRFAITNREEDKFVFKVPGLRNIELTAPYFHNGAAVTLEEAVAGMGRYQLGRKLSQSEITSIVKFLKTLTGEWQGKPLK